VKKLLFTALIVLSVVFSAKAQPGPATFTLNPQPINGQYSTGTVVTFCYNMTGFGGCGTAEWFEGFDLDLGPGWADIQPVTAPADCGGAAGGGQGWIYLTTNNTAVGPVGPGYFYEGPTGPIDGNPSNDWGDAGNCTWSFCVNLTVANNAVAGSLWVNVNVASDGYWGNWGGNGCDFATPVPVLPPSTSISGVPICAVTASSTSTNANNCAGATVTLAASNATGATNYSWTGPNGYTATGQSVQIASSQVSNAGVYTVTATGAATCSGSTTVVVNPVPQMNATTNAPVCVCNPLTLSSGLTATPGLLVAWTGPAYAAINPNPTIACPQIGNSGTYTCTAIQAGCQTQQTVVVLVSPSPTGTVSPGGTYSVCSGATISAQTVTSTPSTAVMNWTNTQPGIGIPATGSGTIPSFTAVNNTNASITSIITVTPTLGTCTGPASTISITVGPSPTITEPASNLYCDGATFAGVDWGAVPSSTLVNWTNDNTSSGLPASGQGNIGSFLLNNPTQGQSLSTFTATPSVGTCIGTPVTFTVTVAGNGDATITDIGPLCSGVGPQTIIAADPTGTWSGLGIVSASGNTSVFDPAIVGPGLHSIYYSIAGQCGGTDGLQIEVVNVPAAFAGLDFSICEGVDTVMVGSFLNSTTGTEEYSWSPAANLINATTLTPTLTATTTQTYTLTVNVGICASSDAVLVTVVPQSDATIIASGPYCSDIAPVQLSAAQTGGTWTGTGITNAATGTFNPTTATPGTYTVTHSIGGFCPASDTEDFVVWPVPDGTITPAGPFCIAELPVTLTAATAGGTWSGTGINNAVSGSFGGPTTTANSYLVTYNTGGNCPRDFTTTVVVNNAANATINAVADICNDAPAVILTAGQSGGTWTGQGVSSTGSFNPAGLIPGDYTVTYTISGACADDDTEDITVLAVPDGTITPAGPFCQDALPQTLSAASSGGTWSGTGINNAATGAFGNSNLAAGNYTVTYTTGGVCPNAFTESIQVIENLDATITSAGPFCENSANQTLTAATAGGVWSGANPITAGGQISPTTLGAGTYTFNYDLNNNGCLSSDNVQVTINALPIPSFTTSSAAGCSPLSVSFTNTSNPLGSSCVWYLDGAPAGSGNSFSEIFTGNSCSDIGIVVTDAAGCSATLTQNDVVCVVSNPSASFSWTPSAPTSGSTVFFDNASLGGVSYTWNIDGTEFTSEDVTYPIPTSASETFQACLEVEGLGGCMDAQCYTLSIYTTSYVYVPNSFTPDGDGNNDVFAPVVTGLSSTSRYSFSVYNRWGDLIFDTKDPKEVWTGDTNGGTHFAEDGAYVYELKIQFSSGEEPFKRMGTVVLVR
jgi:gliding motility-associated-like protein